MARLQNIENALREINDAKFQNLCDSYLALQNPNYRAFSRSGSAAGTQKTRTGTPDSFLLLPNGKYFFVEHSTNISKGLSKLKEDIEKCLDEKKTGIPVQQITEIILCINFRLKTKDVEALREMLQDTWIRLTVETLDSLAMQLHLQHPNLVNEYLGLPIDTGQIVSVDQFISNYQNANSGIATPLNNTYINREKEFADVQQALENSDLIIVTGAPGVGKTRICIEAITNFLEKHHAFDAYCLADKDANLLEDLYQYFDEEGNAILFIDDANRLGKLNQVTQFYRDRKKGSLKLVLTVRDYAYHNIGSICADLHFRAVNIAKFSDELIVELIEAKPFEILNTLYQDPIKSIADGNPRLAIMAAKLGKKAQDPVALGNVSDLFDSYYSTFAKDNELFSNTLTIKSLGLIAFFYTLPLNDRETLEIILNEFDIPYHDFSDLIEQLDKLELVEINFDHVKVPEQNLSMYYFYRAFVKESQLSFSVLLNGFFETNKSRFTETVIYANNKFGQEKVMNKLTPDLKAHWKHIRDDPEKAQKYLETFWFYLQDETFEYVQDIVERLPAVEKNTYITSYKSNDFSFRHESTLDLLRNFFRYASMMPDAIELAFEYVRKKPQHLPELLHHLYELVGFKYDDLNQGIQRQQILFDYLIAGVNANDSLLAAAFYSLSPKFLSYRYDDTSGGRNNTIHLRHIILPASFRPVEDFRVKIWETMKKDFPNNMSHIVEVLRSYATPTPDAVKEILEYELPFVIRVIEKLDPANFDHCAYVHDQIGWWKREEIKHEGFKGLAEKFTSDRYELFKVLDWNRLRDKELFDFDDYKEYEKKKEEQIRGYFDFSSQEEVKTFYKDFIYIKSKSKNDWSYNNVLAIVIDQTFTYSVHLGSLMLALIIEDGNKIGFAPRMLFKNVLTAHPEYSKQLWELIEANDFKNRFEWQLGYFYDVPDDLIDSRYPGRILNAIAEMQGYSKIYFEAFERYGNVDVNMYEEILRAICKKNQEEESFISLGADVFKKNFDKLGDDLESIKIAYLQQASHDNFFDYSCFGLAHILQRDPSFLKEFILTLYDEQKHKFEGGQKLGLIWSIEGIDKELDNVFDIMIEKQLYFGIMDHPVNMFFKGIAEEHKRRAEAFLLEYLKNNSSTPDKVNVVLDVVRNSKIGEIKGVLSIYLSRNLNLDDFKRIYWTGNGGTYSGDVIIGDIIAAKWRNILSIVESLDLGLKGRRIRQYIKQVIEAELKHGDQERKQRFLRNN